jgi:hypothetical protein
LPQTHNFSYRERPKSVALSFVVAVEKLVHAAAVLDLTIGFVGSGGTYFLGLHVHDFAQTAIGTKVPHLGIMLPVTSHA